MKKPVIIGVSALALLTLSATLFAQTATGSSLITQMKAATHAFTLTADLNSGATGLESAPLVGKRTGDMLSAGEYNRLLELVGQGGGGSGGSLEFHQTNIPIPAGNTNLDTLLPKAYIAAFINSCGAATYVDTIPLAYINNSLGNTTCGATMVTPGSHKFELLGNGTGYFILSGYFTYEGGGGGGTASVPSGSLCGSLFTRRYGLNTTTCDSISSIANCAGQTLSVPTSCGTNPCGLMTGCPSGYAPIQTSYSWGGGQTMQDTVYAYHQCSCAKT